MDNLLAKIVSEAGRVSFTNCTHLKRLLKSCKKKLALSWRMFPTGRWCTGTYLEELESARIRPEYLHGGDNGRVESFFCALPAEELEAFRQKLVMPSPSHSYG